MVERFDDRGAVAVEFAMILSTVGLAFLLGGLELAPVVADLANQIAQDAAACRG